jgi:TolB-like protein/tRNA A-37 threonylcarbamoyl transferase component Bud32/tetratricopeptide (TPR) repeat protein
MLEPSLPSAVASESCATCGRPLTQRGPNGECLRCLVRLAISSDNEEPLPPRGSRRRSTPGPLRYAHFRVEVGDDGFPVELGAGAMAVTYRATDTVLNSAVALKVIGSTIADNPAARARFLREARAAAQLQHPNVARVTHYGEQEGECFYVMELVEGETLEALVRRDGPLPLELALEVMEQAARAIAAAEARGIVHRDIKPSNLMIESEASGSMLVKVIDYGVATTASLQTQLGIDQAQSGFVGTPAFASPEQFSGGAETKIDTRSDIYSLGVTLWYLLTGRTPFAGRTLEDIRARQSEELPFDQLKAAKVPAQVTKLIMSMLAIDPAERPQSARELLAAVFRCHKSKQSGRFLWIAGSALAIAAVMFGFWSTRSTRPGFGTQKSLAVLPFENLSPASEDAFFTTGMNEAIVAGLARIKAFRVIGSDSTRSYVPGNRDIGRIARELDVQRLLTGRVRRENGEVRVSVELIDPSNKIGPWTKRYQYPLSGVFTLQSEVMRDVATQLQTTVTMSERRFIEERPTGDPMAYDLYLRAISAPQMYDSAADMRRGLTQKVAWLDEAIARDADFVLAYCELSKTHDEFEKGSANASNEERAIDHRALAEVALQKARRLKPDEGKLHLAQAIHFLLTSRDNEQAHMELDLARQTLPNDAEVEQISGRIARDQGRWTDAIHAFERATALDPRVTNHFMDLADAYRSTRSYELADRVVARLQVLEPADFYYSFWRAQSRLEERGDLDPLRKALNGAPVADEEDRRTVLRTRLVYALFSHDHEALLNTLADWKRPVILFVGISYPKAWFEGLAARMRGDEAAARTAFTDARAVVEPLVQAKPGNAPLLGVLAMIDAALGRKEDALREGRQACELMPAKRSAMGATYVSCQLAVVYAWTDESALALALLDDLTNQAAGETLLFQPTYGDLKLNPLWEPLRRDPRFAALVEKLAPLKTR